MVGKILVAVIKVSRSPCVKVTKFPYTLNVFSRYKYVLFQVRI